MILKVSTLFQAEPTFRMTLGKYFQFCEFTATVFLILFLFAVSDCWPCTLITNYDIIVVTGRNASSRKATGVNMPVYILCCLTDRKTSRFYQNISITSLTNVKNLKFNLNFRSQLATTLPHSTTQYILPSSLKP